MLTKVVKQSKQSYIPRQKNWEKQNQMITSPKISNADYGVTKFSDLSPAEFRDQYLKDLIFLPNLGARPNSTLTPYSRIKSLNIPDKVDWRNYGNQSIISPVKNQMKCGACWAFSAVETVESMYAKLKGKPPLDLSVQQIIDCASNNNGCDGGDTCRALDWMKTARPQMVTDAEYPLTDQSNFCKMQPSGFVGIVVTDFTCNRYVGSEDGMLQLLATVGPLTVSVDATTWQNYQGGIIQWHCYNSNNHAVQIVGYDTSGEIPYYIVRNSWGTDFGHDGYLYIKIGNNVCGIAEEVSTVTVQ
ncbi:hypothetical protein ACJMK2_032643 [Sinanodonta woodiana]|uniref:Peptidase C1A papain C-terminal domain-containing protein n=1 Tax=Sinanodonta woodiana TaxID=1069815 RepID=A0ABD3X2J7_SINWO